MWVQVLLVWAWQAEVWQAASPVSLEQSMASAVVQTACLKLQVLQVQQSVWLCAAQLWGLVAPTPQAPQVSGELQYDEP